MAQPADSSANLDEPLVTVAVPTYNRRRGYMPAAVAAACAQTYRNVEVLVSDNDSSDGTQEFILGLNDPRIRYHRHPQNVGAANNIGFCIDSARGEYLLLLMDDDLIDPDFVACCMAAARRDRDAALVRTGTRVINADGVLLYESPNLVAGLPFEEFVLAWLSGRTAPFLCSTLFRTAPLREIGMRSRNNLWNDVIAEMQLAARFPRIDVPEIKATFRQHGDTITAATDIEKWCDDSQQLLELVCSLAPERASDLRERLIGFLAMFNYRNALRLSRPWPQRLSACWTVRKRFETPPDLREMLREIARQTPWFEALRRAKRALRR